MYLILRMIRMETDSKLPLMQVNPPFEFSKHIAPALLPSKNEVYEDDTLAVVSGFGRTEVTTFNKIN